MSNIYTDITMFNAEWYLEQYPGIEEFGYNVENAAEHYQVYGATDGFMPNDWFNLEFYKEQNPEVAEQYEDGELLFHFAKYGAAEGRSPNAVFSNGEQYIPADLFTQYAVANPELAEHFGIAENADRLNDEQFAEIAYHFFAYGISDENFVGELKDKLIPDATVEDLIPAYQDAKKATAAAVAAEAEAEAAAADAQDEFDAAEAAAATAASKLATEGVQINNVSLPTNFTSLSAEEQADAVAAVKDVLAANVTTAQINVNNLDAGVKAAAQALEAAKADLAQAQTDTLEAGILFGVGLIDGDAVDGNALKVFGDANDGDASVDTADGNFTVSLGDADVIFLNSEGQLAVTNAGKDFEGIDDLLAAANAYYAASQAVPAAVQALGEALVNAAKQELLGIEGFNDVADDAVFVLGDAEDGGEVSLGDAWISVSIDGDASIDEGKVEADFEGGDFKDNVLGEALGAAVDAAEDLADAQADQAAFAALVTAWQEAQDEQNAAQTALDNANDDVTAKQEAVADAQQNQAELKAQIEAAAQGEDINVVEEENGVAEATDGADLFIYTEGQALTINGFDGETDSLYVGQGYVLTQVSNAADIVNKADDSVLEIFVYQDGDNAVLMVEAEVYSGSVAGSQDLTQITLTGVTAADLTEDAGYIA